MTLREFLDQVVKPNVVEFDTSLRGCGAWVEEEDARRLTRERAILVTEQVRHVNRIKGLLATQGVFDFEPIRKDRRTRVESPPAWIRRIAMF